MSNLVQLNPISSPIHRITVSFGPTLVWAVPRPSYEHWVAPGLTQHSLGLRWAPSKGFGQCQVRALVTASKIALYA